MEVTQSEWPSSVCSGAPVAASQSRTVQSSDPDTTCLPSGEKATDLMSLVWPSSRQSGQSDLCQIYVSGLVRILHQRLGYHTVFPMDGWVCGYPSNPSINYEMDIHP